MTIPPKPSNEMLSRPNAWVATFGAAQDRLKSFLPYASSSYASYRNFDYGPGQKTAVSALSPWIRYRMILEEDILRQVLSLHSLQEADKFVQEVLWRSYFKGWLEHRPDVWRNYGESLDSLIINLEKDNALFTRYDTAVSAKTGIVCFDNWAEEVVRTGYLHNHARMWFASIWIFTLRLPWELGADFFLRHLIDGDPASNTCSWRWVAGLHTVGKTYLARAENIKKYTGSRFFPEGELSIEAKPILETEHIMPKALSFVESEAPGSRMGLILTEEDCSVHNFNFPFTPVAGLALSSETQRSSFPTGRPAVEFASAALNEAIAKSEQRFGFPVEECDHQDWADAISTFVKANDLHGICLLKPPVGPVRSKIDSAIVGIDTQVCQYSRKYDRVIWPHAKKGFFGLKKKILEILAALEIHYT